MPNVSTLTSFSGFGAAKNAPLSRSLRKPVPASRLNRIAPTRVQSFRGRRVVSTPINTTALIVMLTVGVSMLVMSAVYIVSVNASVTGGYAVSAWHERIQKLEEDYRRFTYEQAATSSMVNVSEELAKQNFIPVGPITYLETPGSQFSKR